MNMKTIIAVSLLLTTLCHSLVSEAVQVQASARVFEFFACVPGFYVIIALIALSIIWLMKEKLSEFLNH